MNYFNYFSEIEETFIRRRGRNLLLSPLDWALIETWQERGIPLRIVLRGIEKVFDGVDKQPAQKRTVKSLIYCREEIEVQYTEWLKTQVGKNGDGKDQRPKTEVQSPKSPDSTLFPDDAISAHLEKVSIDVKKAQRKAEGELRETLENVSEQLTKLKDNSQETESLEKSLEKLDALIDQSLLKYSETEKLKAEIEKQIASYKNKMEAEVYRRTFDLMLLKRLRERAEIPRLSLFYL
jgi:signal recognition particle GTPase